jgi:hypothetical protein
VIIKVNAVGKIQMWQGVAQILNLSKERKSVTSRPAQALLEKLISQPDVCIEAERSIDPRIQLADNKGASSVFVLQIPDQLA